MIKLFHKRQSKRDDEFKALCGRLTRNTEQLAKEYTLLSGRLRRVEDDLKESQSRWLACLVELRQTIDMTQAELGCVDANLKNEIAKVLYAKVTSHE